MGLWNWLLGRGKRSAIPEPVVPPTGSDERDAHHGLVTGRKQKEPGTTTDRGGCAGLLHAVSRAHAEPPELDANGAEGDLDPVSLQGELEDPDPLRHEPLIATTRTARRDAVGSCL